MTRHNPPLRIQARYIRAGQTILSPIRTDAAPEYFEVLATERMPWMNLPNDVSLVEPVDISNVGDWFRLQLENEHGESFPLLFPADKYVTVVTGEDTDLVWKIGRAKVRSKRDPALRNPSLTRISTPQELRLYKDTGDMAARHHRRGTHAFYDEWQQLYNEGAYSPRRNPAYSNRSMSAAERHYVEFHGTEPDSVTVKQLWVPGKLVQVGRGDAIDVGYEIGSKRSAKGYKNLYVHDFGSKVKIYRRAKNGEKPSKVYKNFPAECMVLGYNIGFSFKDKNGKLKEVKGSKRKKLAAPDRRTLVVIGPKGVEYLMKGGDMHVSDWIRK